MTVTVPPQHRLGGLINTPRTSTLTPITPQSAYKTPAGPSDQITPHSYQIKMPAGASPLTTSPFKSGDDPAVTITTPSTLTRCLSVQDCLGNDNIERLRSVEPAKDKVPKKKVITKKANMPRISENILRQRSTRIKRKPRIFNIECVNKPTYF